VVGALQNHLAQLRHLALQSLLLLLLKRLVVKSPSLNHGRRQLVKRWAIARTPNAKRFK
jgi:hypothetical protein